MEPTCPCYKVITGVMKKQRQFFFTEPAMSQQEKPEQTDCSSGSRTGCVNDSLKQNLILLKLLGPTKVSELAQTESNPQFGRQQFLLNCGLVSSSKAEHSLPPCDQSTTKGAISGSISSRALFVLHLLCCLSSACLVMQCSH